MKNRKEPTRSRCLSVPTTYIVHTPPPEMEISQANAHIPQRNTTLSSPLLRSTFFHDLYTSQYIPLIVHSPFGLHLPVPVPVELLPYHPLSSPCLVHLFLARSLCYGDLTSHQSQRPIESAYLGSLSLSLSLLPERRGEERRRGLS